MENLGTTSLSKAPPSSLKIRNPWDLLFDNSILLKMYSKYFLLINIVFKNNTSVSHHIYNI